MAKVELYQCESCQGLGKRIVVVEVTVTKQVTNASASAPHILRTEVCSMECLLEIIDDKLGSVVKLEDD